MGRQRATSKRSKGSNLRGRKCVLIGTGTGTLTRSDAVASGLGAADAYALDTIKVAPTAEQFGVSYGQREGMYLVRPRAETDRHSEDRYGGHDLSRKSSRATLSESSC